MFLVDPTLRIPSATDVAPQQRDSIQAAMRQAGENSLLSRLPVELIDAVAGFTKSTMSWEEAEAYRLKLMRERTPDYISSQYFGSKFNMWYVHLIESIFMSHVFWCSEH
jgi:hypothetical protein